MYLKKCCNNVETFILQVYKTQLERIADGWTNKVGSFERQNYGLQDEVNHLKRENDELKTKVCHLTFKKGRFASVLFLMTHASSLLLFF